MQISFSNTTLLSFGIRTFCCGGCSVHCRMFSSIPGLYSLDISSTPHTHTHSCDNQKHPLHKELLYEEKDETLNFYHTLSHPGYRASPFSSLYPKPTYPLVLVLLSPNLSSVSPSTLPMYTQLLSTAGENSHMCITCSATHVQSSSSGEPSKILSYVPRSIPLPIPYGSYSKPLSFALRPMFPH